ncbi:MAG: hypothetical protein IT422_29655 [Pirellulaceae bacterium]|nr:hypothetical protein [Pirellulaceae bacterium]
MKSVKLATHARCATLENLPSRICDGGPLFQLGKVVLEQRAWEIIPSAYLLQALELHSCGIYGDLEDYEIYHNSHTLRSFEEYNEGRSIYRSCIYSRWKPPHYQSFMVMTYWTIGLVTAVTAANV